MKADHAISLVTGATGYVGGRLLRRLVENGDRVRAMVRNPRNLQLQPNERTEVVKGDVFQPETLVEALRGVDTAFYLIH
ncbi:MAG: NAD(P)H-binding protein [Bryobacterales bacterium]|nr:NAD(P)H-binding protein [Bryobacterales bacterium]